MAFGSVLVGVAAISVYGFMLLGLPLIWAVRQRAHRSALAARQIALTDALDAEFGPVITPVVVKPFRGPWVVRLAVPLIDSRRLSRALAVMHAVLSDPDFGAEPYELVLAPVPGGAPVQQCPPPRPPASRHAQHHAVAA